MMSNLVAQKGESKHEESLSPAPLLPCSPAVIKISIQPETI